MSFGEFYTGVAGLGKAYSDGLEEHRQRTGLAKLGQMIQGGDYGGAASTAFDLGDTQTGVGLLKLGQAQRQQQLEQQAGAAFAQGLGALGSSFGLGGVEPQASPVGRTSSTSRALPSFADDSAPSGSYVANLFKRESNNNPNAQASTSSAKGLGQFTDKTWAGVMRAHPDLGLTADGRTDPNQMLRATNAFTADNERILQRAGLPVNDSTRYASHFLGASGGPRFVAGAMQNPDAPAVSFVQPEQARANRRIFFNRDGSPKTAGQVMADFGGSFGGGAPTQTAQRAPGAPVAYAGNEAETQALEQRMGMVPTQTAEADMPAVDATEAAFYIPGTDPAARPAPSAASANGGFPPSIGGNGRLTDRPTGNPSGERVMQMPGAPEAVPAAQPVATADAGGAIGNAPAAAITQAPLGQRIPFLLKAAAMPNLPDAQRQLAQTLLKQALDETKMPDQVKEYHLARSQGFGGSYLDYQRELKRPGGPTVLSAGQTVYDPVTNTGRFTAPSAERPDKVTADVEARRSAAVENGLLPGSPAYQSFVLTGKMPREDAPGPSAGDRKTINQAEDQSLQLDSTLDTLARAKELNNQTFTGATAGIRGKIGTTVPGAGVFLDPKAAAATAEFNKIMSMEAIKSMSATLKGATTDREMDRFVDILGDPATPPDIRARTIDRMMSLAQRQKELAEQRVNEMRGGTYYRPGGGGSAGGTGRQPGSSSQNAPAGQQRALPAPSQANRPGAVSPQDRYGQLVGGGLSKAQAYEQMHQEGY